MYSVITTVTEFTVTSRVCPLDRSMFFSRGGYFDLLFLFRDVLLPGDLEFCAGVPEAPGKACVAACCATSAELRRGLRVDVPGTE